jgi:hypothetical protein
MCRLCVCRIGIDVAAELACQITDGSEHAASNDVALYFGEPEFDLIEPRGVSGGVVEPDPAAAADL